MRMLTSFLAIGTSVACLSVSAEHVYPATRHLADTPQAIDDRFAVPVVQLSEIKVVHYFAGWGFSVVRPLNVKRASEAIPCRVETSDLSGLRTGSEISDLLSRYSMVCSQQLAVALDDIYNDEARDSQWAAPLEERIKQTAGALPGLEVEGSCHTSICRFNFRPTGLKRGPLHDEFDRPLIASLSTTRPAVSTVDVAAPGGYVKYFCSNTAPAAFVVPLKQKMQGTPRL